MQDDSWIYRGNAALRRFGLDLVGEVPWGTHFCQFYSTKEDLIEILVPYFAEGLGNNEFCIWVTCPPLNVKQAKAALRKAVPELDDYIKKGQIEILPYNEWYLLDGKFDSDRILQGLVEKEKEGLDRGFDGLRISGNTFWTNRSLWKNLASVEAAANSVIASHRIIALCTYSLKKCNGAEVVDVLRNHIGNLIRKEKDWYVVEDVVHRKDAERELIESEYRYRSLFANMNSAFAYQKIIQDNHGKPVDYVFLEVNDDFEKITGLKKDDILGKRVTEVLPGIEKDPVDWIGIYGKVALTRKPVRFENYAQALKKWFSVSAYSPAKGYFAAAFDDITDRKLAGIALRESEQRWATTLASIGDAVIATDLHGRVSFMNAVAEKLTGWSFEEASQKPIKKVFNIINEQTRLQLENPVAKVLEKGGVIGLANHTLLIRKDGKEIPIDDSGSPIRDENGKITGVVLIFRDITERRRMEAELSNLAKFPSENPNVVLRVNKDGVILYLNPIGERVLKSLIEASAWKLPEHWNKHVSDALSSGKQHSFEEQINGLTYLFVVGPIVSESYVNIYGEDITERKKVEKALVSAKSEWERTFDSVPDLIAILDNQHRIVRANRAMAQRLGTTPDRCIGLKCYKCVHGTSVPPEFCPYTQTLQDGKEHVAEVHEDRLGGDFLVSTSPLRDEEGHMIGSVHVARDITEHKKAEDAIRRLKDRFEMAQRAAGAGVWEWNVKTNDIEWTPEMFRLFGLDPQKGAPSFESWNAILHPADRKKAAAKIDEALRTHSFLDSEYRIVRPDGQIVWINTLGQGEYDDHNLPVRMSGICIDITERKKAEDAIKKSEERWRSYIEVTGGLGWTTNAEGEVVEDIPSWRNFTGQTFEEIKGSGWSKALHPDDMEKTLNVWKQATLEKSRYEVEYRVRRHDGVYRHFMARGIPVFNKDGTIREWVGSCIDITERKAMEQALRDRQSDLNRAQAVAKTGSWRLDTRSKLLLWSDETYRMFDISKGTPLTYETFLGTVHPDDRAYVDKMWKAALNGAAYEIDHRIIVNGEIKWVREKAELEFDKDKVLKGGFGTVQDITERKKAEQELVDTLEASHHRQAEISALLDASKAVLVHRDFSKAARSIFDSCKELLGATAGYVALLSKDEMKNEVLFLDSGGLPCTVDPSLPMPVRGLRAEAYRTGKVVYSNDFSNSEWSSLMPKGHVALKNVLFAPLTIDNKTVGIIGLANKDSAFTERDAQMASAFGEIASIALINSQMLEKLEENEKLLKAHSESLEKMVEEKTKQLKNAERLSAIGETAGMVGHDIRNPLQAIIGELYLSKDELASLPDGEVKKSLKDNVKAIEEQVTYINKIVTDLQDYAKPLAPCFENTDLEIIIQSVLSTMYIPEAIEVTYSVEDNFPNLMTDPSYMRRILTNLVSNAVQAMPNGGRISIQAYRKDDKAFVNVEDTGEGITEEAKGRIFKPLFTTKAKGQGFGLAVVKKLTDALNGIITFESEPGKGTKFIIELPIKG